MFVVLLRTIAYAWNSSKSLNWVGIFLAELKGLYAAALCTSSAQNLYCKLWPKLTYNSEWKVFRYIGLWHTFLYLLHTCKKKIKSFENKILQSVFFPGRGINIIKGGKKKLSTRWETFRDLFRLISTTATRDPEIAWEKGPFTIKESFPFVPEVSSIHFFFWI